MAARSSSRQRLVAVAERQMLARGYAGTSLDDVCRAAGVTKGALFHHFKSKEALGAAVLDAFFARVGGAFRSAASATDDPAARALALVDTCVEVFRAPRARATCLLASFAQDVAAAKLRDRAGAHFTEWIDAFARHFTVALGDAALARSHAEQVVTTLEGALIVARARGDYAVVERSLARCRAHLVRDLKARSARHHNDDENTEDR